MARTSRVIVPGFLHHITQRGNRQEPVFFDDTDRLFYLEKLNYYSRRSGLFLASYCLMTNHTHLLVVPEGKRSLELTFKPLHLCYSIYLNKKFNRSGLNWQGRFFSSPMDNSHSWMAFQYVALNPVVAGMAENFIDYVWSSSRDLVLGAANQYLTADPKWLNMGSRALQDLLQRGELAANKLVFEEIEKSTSKNLPIGSSDFIKQLENETGRILTRRPMGRPKKRIQ